MADVVQPSEETSSGSEVGSLLRAKLPGELGAFPYGPWKHRRTDRARRLRFGALGAAPVPGQASLPPEGSQLVVDVKPRVRRDSDERPMTFVDWVVFAHSL